MKHTNEGADMLLDVLLNESLSVDGCFGHCTVLYPYFHTWLLIHEICESFIL